MIDLRHPLTVLASYMPWQELEARVAHLLARKARAGEVLPDLDLFGEKVERRPRVSFAGRPRVPLRVMISLLYLKHAFDESDEGVVERWRDTPLWRYFSRCAYYEDRLPCDATTLVKFRQRLGEEGVEALLAQTIEVAVQLKLVRAQDLERVVADTTVQLKAIAHPTDSRLLEVARAKLVDAAKDAGIALKQAFAKEGRALARQAGRYAHARQFRRMRRVIRRQGTIVGRLMREIERKASRLGEAVRQALMAPSAKAQRIVAQSRERKAVDGSPKLYAWHAPEGECINKGRARQPDEFGVKVSIATTLQGNLIAGAKAFHGNPYDGHTLAEQLAQTGRMMCKTGVKPHTVFVDLGYRGVDARCPDVRIVHRGKAKRSSRAERRLLKRRQAIEPIIGLLKTDQRMSRCHLKGAMGDRLHAVLCAAGLQHTLAAAHDCQEEGNLLAAAFFCALSVGAPSGKNPSCQAHSTPAVGAWMNISWTIGQDYPSGEYQISPCFWLHSLISRSSNPFRGEPHETSPHPSALRRPGAHHFRRPGLRCRLEARPRLLPQRVHLLPRCLADRPDQPEQQDQGRMGRLLPGGQACQGQGNRQAVRQQGIPRQDQGQQQGRREVCRRARTGTVGGCEALPGARREGRRSACQLQLIFG
jgi:IS5 family transposase